MQMKSKISALVATGTLLAIAACGDDDATIPDPQPDASVDAAPRKDAGDGDDTDGGPKPDAGDGGDGGDVTDPIKHITLKLEDVIAAAPPVGPSSYGFASSANAYGGAGTSWRYQKPLTGAADEKFEFYFPFTEEAAQGNADMSAIHDYLGDVTIADIQSIKLHSRRNDATTPDFTMLLYTEPHAGGSDNEAGWYARRLHASFAWAAKANAPPSTWNEFSTSATANELRFWDFRKANVNQGEQPNDNYFSLADMQGGPVTPQGVTGARDYRTEKLKFLTISSFSSDAAFDASIDGIEIVLKNGKGVDIDLAGDANVRRVSLSRSRLVAVDPPDTGSSFGEVSNAEPWGKAGVSWKYKKTGTSPANEKFELYLTFATPAEDEKTALWKGVHEHLGEFTMAEIESIGVHSKKHGTSTNDFTMIVYTLPKKDGDDDDSWYRRRLHAQLDWSDQLDAPADTWNAFSTNAGANQLRFWDFRPTNAAPGAYFTLANMQAGAVTPTGLGARDYRTEKVRYISFSTYTGYSAFEGSIDGIEVRLKNNKKLVVDLDE